MPRDLPLPLASPFQYFLIRALYKLSLSCNLLISAGLGIEDCTGISYLSIQPDKKHRVRQSSWCNTRLQGPLLKGPFVMSHTAVTPLLLDIPRHNILRTHMKMHWFCDFCLLDMDWRTLTGQLIRLCLTLENGPWLTGKKYYCWRPSSFMNLQTILPDDILHSRLLIISMQNVLSTVFYTCLSALYYQL